MAVSEILRAALVSTLLLTLASCGGGLSSGDSGLFRGSKPAPTENIERQRENTPQAVAEQERRNQRQSSLFDLFSNNNDPNTTVEVNKYIWRASLEVLNFLPIESVDPFSGVIVTGYGTPPGGGRSYRATVLVQDPALDARSLKLALATRAGAVDADTTRAVEDAILTRARQLRIQDSNL